MLVSRVLEVGEAGPVAALQGFLSGLMARLDAETPDGTTTVVSDLTWKATDDANAVWNPGTAGEDAWHRPFARIGEREMVGH